MASLLLVIDFINDIVHPEGKISTTAHYVQENNVIENANTAIKHARLQHIQTAFVKVGFSKDYAECPKNSPIFSAAPRYSALQLGTWGTEFHEKLDVNENDFVIIKHRISALYNTDLETLLRANHVDTVYIAGVSTNMAITLTARELHDRDYNVIILEDACGAADKKTHDRTLKDLERIATITTASSLA